MKCPGQDTQFWGYGAIFEADCPDCGATVEFFKDDTMRTCPGCGKRLANPKLDFGCASYCQFADACLGSLPAELLAEKRNLIKDRVAVEVKKACGRDFARIGLASAMARHAELIAESVEGADRAVLLCAATLSVLEREKAEEILQGIGAPEGLMDEVVALLKGDASESDHAAILTDARFIAEAEGEKSRLSERDFDGHIVPNLALEASKAVARKTLVSSS